MAAGPGPFFWAPGEWVLTYAAGRVNHGRRCLVGAPGPRSAGTWSRTRETGPRTRDRAPGSAGSCTRSADRGPGPRSTDRAPGATRSRSWVCGPDHKHRPPGRRKHKHGPRTRRIGPRTTAGAPGTARTVARPTGRTARAWFAQADRAGDRASWASNRAGGCDTWDPQGVGPDAPRRKKTRQVGGFVYYE